MGGQRGLRLKLLLETRARVAVCDSSFSAIDPDLGSGLAAVREHVTVVTRLRLDAALYEPAAPRRPGQVGRPRKKGQLQASMEPAGSVVELKAAAGGIEDLRVQASTMEQRI